MIRPEGRSYYTKNSYCVILLNAKTYVKPQALTGQPLAGHGKDRGLIPAFRAFVYLRCVFFFFGQLVS